MRVFKDSKKTILIGIVLASIILQLFLPTHNAQAQLGALPTIAGNLFGCAVDATLNTLFDETIDKGIDFLVGLIPFLGDEDVPISDKFDEKRTIKNCVSAGIKREIISAIVIDILDFVRGEGDPRYFQNFGDELVRVADGATAEFLREYTGVDICSYFSPHLRILVDDIFRPRAKRYSCTLSRAIDNPDRFFDDFRYGGWNTWISIHESRNTLLGAYLLTYNEKLTLFEEKKEAAILGIQVSDGFKSSTKCTQVLITSRFGDVIEQDVDVRLDGDSWNIFVEDLRRENTDFESIVCIEEDIITPASIIAQQTNRAISAEVDNLINSDSYYEILRIVITTAIVDVIRNGL